VRPTARHGFACLVLAGACSGSGGPGGIEAGTVGSHARVRVELSLEGPRAELTASARFLRYRDVDALTADVLAGGSAADPLEPGECALVSATPDDRLGETLALLPERELMSRAAVVHLDAGDLAILVDGLAASSIQPLLAPALAPYVGGVEYEELALTVGEVGVPDGAEVVITGFGGDDVSAFEASVALPPVPASVTATLDDELHVAWAAPAAGASAPVIVDVQPGFGEDALRCAFPDSGALAIDAATLAGLPGFAPGDDLVVSIERTVTTPLAAPGVQVGVLEAAVRYVVIASAP
jgi:hypothetical protein